MGNQWGWWGDPDSAAARGASGIVTGSHLDSVPDGGAFDGPLGVVSALAALDELRDRGFEPGRPIGVVNFVDEEGSRFGVACAGSRVITGALSPDRARSLTDADGTTMAEALATAGRDPALLGPDPEALARIGAFVELHVEQGRGLVDLDHPVALGTDIWPHGRWRLDFPGEANHAGTTRLEDRQDAMLGYAHAVLAARHAAETARVRRHDRQGRRRARRRQRHRQRRHRLARRPGRRRGVRSSRPSPTVESEAAARRRHRHRGVLDPHHGLRPPAGRAHPRPARRHTGARHRRRPRRRNPRQCGHSHRMLFVRNPTGVSHSPEECAEADDCYAGVARPAPRCLTDLAGATP